MQELRPTGDEVRYPFLDEARETLTSADVDMAELLEENDAVVERALERVRLGLTRGETGGMHWKPHVELLSYPVARVLVSALAPDASAPVVDAYAHAEAATFRERAVEQLAEENDTAAVTKLATAVGVDASVGNAPGTYHVALDAFLNYAPDTADDEDGWSLSEHPTVGGRVHVEYEELLTLMQNAAADEIQRTLPHDLDHRVGLAAEQHLDELRDELTTSAAPVDFREVRPDHMPPCLSALLERARDGEVLDPPAESALVAFLGTAGMDAQTIADLTGHALDPEFVEYELDRLVRDGDVVVEPPDCAAMVDYGLCVDPDDLCEEIDTPFGYYRAALDEAE